MEHSTEELNELEAMIRGLSTEIAQIDKETVIGPAWLPNVCPWCDYLKLCRKRTGWNVQDLTATSC